MFRILEHARYRWIGMVYLLTLLALGISLIFIQPQIGKAIFFGSFCALVLIVDRLIECWLRRAFKVAYCCSFKPTNVGDILYVNARLSLLAENIQRAVEAERRHEASPLGLGMQDAQHNVRCALKNFWRAYWLAKIFDFEVKKSWKGYLPPAQAA